MGLFRFCEGSSCPPLSSFLPCVARPSSILALVAGYKGDGAGCFEFVVGCVSVVLVFLGGCEFFPPGVVWLGKVLAVVVN